LGGREEGRERGREKGREKKGREDGKKGGTGRKREREIIIYFALRDMSSQAQRTDT